jgi:hypothetical protein
MVFPRVALEGTAFAFDGIGDIPEPVSKFAVGPKLTLAGSQFVREFTWGLSVLV